MGSSWDQKKRFEKGALFSLGKLVMMSPHCRAHSAAALPPPGFYKAVIALLKHPQVEYSHICSLMTLIGILVRVLGLTLQGSSGPRLSLQVHSLVHN